MLEQSYFFLITKKHDQKTAFPAKNNNNRPRNSELLILIFMSIWD